MKYKIFTLDLKLSLKYLMNKTCNLTIKIKIKSKTKDASIPFQHVNAKLLNHIVSDERHNQTCLSGYLCTEETCLYR